MVRKGKSRYTSLVWGGDPLLDDWKIGVSCGDNFLEAKALFFESPDHSQNKLPYKAYIE